MAEPNFPGYLAGFNGFNTKKAVDAGAGYTGPPLTDLSRWWNASTPLLSAEGDEVVYTRGGTAPTVGTAHGLDAVKFTADGQYYTAVHPSFGTLNTSFCQYALISIAAHESSQKVLQALFGSVNSDVTYVMDSPFCVSGVSTQSYFATDLDSVNGPTQTTLNEAVVFVIEYAGGTNFIRAGINGVFGSYNSSAHPNYAINRHCVGHDPALDYALTLKNTWIMDALTYVGAAYNQDVVDWLLARTS